MDDAPAMSNSPLPMTPALDGAAPAARWGRALLVALLAGLLALPLLGVSGSSSPALASDYRQRVDITFPVAGDNHYRDDFSACRGTNCSRRHGATDIMTPYGTPVHAAMGGEITFITGMDGNPPSYGYMIRIAGDDGRTYNYIHLGSQTGPPSDAYVSGLRRGSRVERGEQIGYAGHSGNASPSAPHLHFEISDSSVSDPYGGTMVNPYASLKDAEARGDVPGAQAVSLPPSECSGEPYALAGDWNGSGRDGVGWWCDGKVRLRAANGHVTHYTYGRAGDVPVSGDFNGDGRDTVTIVRDGTWHVRNSLSGGSSDRSFRFGRVDQGDVPITGDWNGDGSDTIGIIRDGEWHLRHSLAGGNADVSFRFGRITEGDRPLVGDWNGDGRDRVGIVREGEWHLRHSLSGGPGELVYVYGRVLSGDLPLMGDWNGNGLTTPVIARDDHDWYLRDQHRGGNADRVIELPIP